jgi:hypothetical protein
MLRFLKWLAIAVGLIIGFYMGAASGGVLRQATKGTALEGLVDLSWLPADVLPLGVGGGALILGALLAGLIGGWIAARFSVADVALLQDESRSPFDALFRSRNMVRGRVIRVMAAFTPIYVVHEIVGTVVAQYGGVLDRDPAAWTYPVNAALDLLLLLSTVLMVVLYEALTAPDTDEDSAIGGEGLEVASVDVLGEALLDP